MRPSNKNIKLEKCKVGAETTIIAIHENCFSNFARHFFFVYLFFLQSIIIYLYQQQKKSHYFIFAKKKQPAHLFPIIAAKDLHNAATEWNFFLHLSLS